MAAGIAGKGLLMRLADFIRANIEPILAEWEIFARSIWPGPATDPATLRDHAEDILRATASDMMSAQSATQQSDKSKGDGDAGAHSVRVDKASTLHGAGRVQSGFDLLAVASEYRALRATVIRLWRESAPHPDGRDLDDLTRFNESIDQSLAEAQRTYTEAVDRSRRMFLGILSHDLRGPLHAIISSAKVLSLMAKLDVESSEIVSGVSSSAVAMARMVNDLLDFTAAGLGAAMPLSPVAMDLENLCKEVVEETRAAYPTGKVGFQAHGDLTGEWDAGRLRQVLSNLLGNAVQHGGGTGPVELSARGEGSHVRLAIRNGGPPIPPDAMPTIFDPLVRVSSPESQKKRRCGSIGLGLYIAREVAIAHGGDIDVKSSEEGGTVFTVCLPRNRASGDPNERASI
jgi:signal transduction histidine kinase